MEVSIFVCVCVGGDPAMSPVGREKGMYTVFNAETPGWCVEVPGPGMLYLHSP